METRAHLSRRLPGRRKAAPMRRRLVLGCVLLLAAAAPSARAGAPYADQVQKAGPSAYWRLGEAPGATTIADSSGNGATGAVHGGVTFGVPGAVATNADTAARLDGVSGFATFGDRFDFTGVKPFSLELWVKPRALPPDGEYRQVVSKEDDGGPSGRQGYVIELSSYYGFAFARWVDGSQVALVTRYGFGRIDAGVWYHLMATYDGSTMKLFVDGTLAGSTSDTRGLVDRSEEFTLASRSVNRAPSDYFDGDIDDVAVYNRALTTSEVQNHWSAAFGPGPAGRPEVSSSLPIGYWRFGEAPGAVAALDSSPTGAVGSYRSTTLGVPGAFADDADTAARFDGSSTVKLGDRYDFGGNAPFTIEAWVKPSTVSAGSSTRIATKEYREVVNGSWVRNGWALQMDGAYGFTLERWVNNVHPGVSSYTRILPGRWYHVVGTYDGANVRIYVDGAQRNSGSDTAAMPDNPGPFCIGANDWAPAGSGYVGDLDDVAVYDHALSRSEVWKHYAYGPPATYKDAVLADQPRGYWRLGEDPGATVAADASGSGLDGTYRANTSAGAPGALQFDSDTAGEFTAIVDTPAADDVYMGDQDALDFGTSDFSVEAWVSTTVSGENPIVSKDAGTGPFWRVTVTDDSPYVGRVRARINDGTSDQVAYGPSVLVNDGDWHHVVVVFDRGWGVRIVVDGAEADTYAPTPGDVSNTGAFRIGDDASDHLPFNGYVDEVAVYPYALSAARARAHYTAAVDEAAPLADEVAADDPTGYWRLGDAAGSSVAADASGNGVDGTYRNGASPGADGAVIGDSDAAGRFPGSSSTDDVYVGDLDSLDFGTSDFTVEAWIKTTAANEEIIASKSDGTAPRWYVSVTDDAGDVGRMRAKIDTATSYRVAYGPPIRVDDGSWHHVAAVFDRDVGIYVYVDGVEQLTTGAAPETVSNTAPFRIGGEAEHPSFGGTIDEVAVYDYALTPDRIARHYNAGIEPVQRPLDLEDSTLPEEDGIDVATMYPADVPDDASGDPVDAAPDGGDSASYAAEKQAADQEYLDAEAAGIVAAEDPDAAATPATEIFGGLNEYGLAATGDVTPADSTGAIGRSYYVEMVNRQVAVYKRSDLSRVALLGLRDFVTRGRVGHFTVFDPQIMFDAQTNRWYYAADRVDGSKGTNNHLAFGWSKTSDPSNLSSGWCNFITPSTTEFDDYPKLGDNNRFMIVGTNLFTNAINGPPDGSRIWAIRKPLKGVTRCPKRAPHMKRWTVKPSDIEKPLTPVPADTSTSTSNGYVVGADRGDGKLKVWRISGVKTPKLAKVLDISVPSWKVPASVPQPGNDNKLATLDGRLTQAVADVDPAVKRVAVWTQQTVRGNDGRSVVRWYELLPGRKDDPIRQRGTISRSGLFVFNGAVAPATDGTDAVIDFNVGGRKVLAEIHARSRKASTDLGHMVGGINLGGSTDPDQDFSCSPCRWGDYAGATPDPKRTRVVWGTSEVLGPPSGDKAHWRTRNFALKPG